MGRGTRGERGWGVVGVLVRREPVGQDDAVGGSSNTVVVRVVVQGIPVGQNESVGSDWHTVTVEPGR